MTFLLTFHDIASSLSCENFFKKAGVDCELDTVPPSLGLSCGYAVRCDVADEFALFKLLREHGISVSRIVPWSSS